MMRERRSISNIGPERTWKSSTDFWTPWDCRGASWKRGVSAADPNAPAPFVALANLYFNTTDEVHEGFKTHGREILGDIKNYTDVSPQFQISEVL